MTALKVLAFAAVVCVAGGAARADDKKDTAKLVVGKWEVTRADPGTVPEGTLVEFAKGGKLKVVARKDGTDFTAEGTYTVEGDKLSMTLKIGDVEKTNTITVTKISAGALSVKDKDGRAVEMKKK